MTRRMDETRMSCLTAVASFGGALAIVSPSIAIGDSAELAAVGATLGVGHSPGYPLYAILGRLWSAVLPWGNAAYRMNLFSAACVAASAGFWCWTLARLTGRPRLAAAIALLGAWTPLAFAQASTAEVFGLQTLFASAILALCTSDPTPRRGWLAVFLLALGLGNNHTLILLAPCVAAAFLPALGRRLWWMGAALSLALLGAAIYLYLPLRAAQGPVMNWEEPTTWGRFWDLVTRARYGTFQLAQGHRAPLTAEALESVARFVARTTAQNLHWFSPLALLAFWRRDLRRPAMLLALAFAATGPLFLLLTPLPDTPSARFILERFFYLPFVPLLLLTGLGLSRLLDLVPPRSRPWTTGLVGCTVIAAAAWNLASRPLWNRANVMLWDMGRALLRSTPTGARLLADRADEAEFAIAYLQRVERFRADVRFVDCNAGVSPSMYGPGYYRQWGLPRLAARYARESQIVASSSGPVYYATHDPRMIAIPREQEGLLFRVPSTAKPTGVAWESLVTVRVPRDPEGRSPAWDRGHHGDVLEKLGRAAAMRGDVPAARRLFLGVFGYTGSGPWRRQVDAYLSQLERRR